MQVQEKKELVRMEGKEIHRTGWRCDPVQIQCIKIDSLKGISVSVQHIR